LWAEEEASDDAVLYDFGDARSTGAPPWQIRPICGANNNVGKLWPLAGTDSPRRRAYAAQRHVLAGFATDQKMKVGIVRVLAVATLSEFQTRNGILPGERHPKRSRTSQQWTRNQEVN
jgi:hypothetical protein